MEECLKPKSKEMDEMATANQEKSFDIDKKMTGDGYKPSDLSELLCCPFCGGPAIMKKIWFAASWRYYIICAHCLVAPQGYDPGSKLGDHHQSHWKTEQGASILWNRRAT